MLAALLAADGVSFLPRASVAHQLAAHLAASPAVVSNAYPPYGVHEFPPAVGKIPPHRADAGALLIADAFGAVDTLFVKDAERVGDTPALVAAAELLDRDPAELPVDRMALELMAHTKHVTRIQIVNGLVPGTITRPWVANRSGSPCPPDRARLTVPA